MASTWGDSWGTSWADSWGAVAAAVAVTIAGKVEAAPAPRISRATQYYYKTLTELREEEQAKLKRLERQAKRKLAKAIKAGETSEGFLASLAKAPFEQAAPEAEFLTPRFIDAIAQEILATYLLAILQRQVEEDDIEVLLLAAA